MIRATFDWLSLKLLGAIILGDLLCKLSFYLLDLIWVKRCSYGELNAAIRFGARKERRLTCALVNIIYEKVY